MSVTVDFSPVTALPDASLSGDAGPVNAALVERGLTGLVEAAAWLRDQPYGHNLAEGPLTLFDEGVGTCVTKHAAFVTAAQELGVDVALVWGTYPLTDDVVTGVGAVLERHRLPFVPTIHCFLRHGDARVDLTEGNCNGKNVQITEYLRVDEVAVGTDEGPHRRTVVDALCAEHPDFAGATPDQVASALADCAPAITTACRLASEVARSG